MSVDEIVSFDLDVIFHGYQKQYDPLIDSKEKYLFPILGDQKMSILMGGYEMGYEAF